VLLWQKVGNEELNKEVVVSEVKTITVEAVAERQVEWVPKGWGKASRIVAIIRDGKIDRFPQVDGYFVEADPDGCIEFIRAIKRAMAETAK